MTGQKRRLDGLGVNNAVCLRWVLRDINGQRLDWSRPDPNDLRFLQAMGLIEIRDGVPALTQDGLSEIKGVQDH